jgi:small multidrug resistance pump
VHAYFLSAIDDRQDVRAMARLFSHDALICRRRFLPAREQRKAVATDIQATIMTYILLAAAIVAEVIATSALARTDGFTRLMPSVLAFLGYALAFYLLSLVTRTVPVGIVYAVWSGAGIVLVAMAGWLLFGQKLDLAAVIGLALIIAGVLIINLVSKSVSH